MRKSLEFVRNATGVATGLALGYMLTTPVAVAALDMLPVISLLNPSANQEVSGHVTFYAAADSEGIVSLRFQVDGQDYGSEITSGSCRATWDTSQAGDGLHTVQAIARDEFNNIIASQPVTVRVNNFIPPPPSPTPTPTPTPTPSPTPTPTPTPTPGPTPPPPGGPEPPPAPTPTPTPTPTPPAGPTPSPGPGSSVRSRTRTGQPLVHRIPTSMKPAEGGSDGSSTGATAGTAKPRSAAPPPNSSNSEVGSKAPAGSTGKAPGTPATAPKPVIGASRSSCKGPDPYAKYDGFVGICVGGTWMPARKGQ